MESLMNRFVQSQGDICNDRTGRLREIPCRPMMKKICVICEICVTKKTSQEKSVYICEICGTKFASDFTDESEGILAYRITHGFARIFGRWSMAGAQSVPLLFFVTQISQMTQIFFVGVFCPTDFTDFHRFFYGISLSYLRGYLQRPDRSPPRKSVSNRLSRKPPNKFRVIR